MNKGIRLMKRLVALVLVLLLSIESFGAVVSDNDGSAFITKAEFDSLKINFQSQIDQYNISIDSKIDGAIASYLEGVSVSKSGTVNVLNDGIYWSIGPFDRPRYKQGKCIYDLMQSRVGFKLQYAPRYDSAALFNITWGNDFRDKTEFVNSEWIYNDIIVDNASSDGGLYRGWYTNSSHFMQQWQIGNYQTDWNDTYAAALNSGDRLLGCICGFSFNVYNNIGGIGMISLRPGRLGIYEGQGNPVWARNEATANGTSCYYTINKGSKIGWDQNISVFGPIEYHCFNAELNSDNDLTLNMNAGIRDEILWESVPAPAVESSGHTNITNMLYKHVYDDAEPSVNPWNKSSLTGAKSQVWSGVVEFNNTTEYIGREYQDVFSISMGRGYASWSDSITQGWGMTKWLMPDCKFLNLTNYNQLGANMDSVVRNYLSSISTNATFNDKNNDTLLSLAAGLPVCVIEKKRKINVKGEIRKNCAYSYNPGSKTNTLDEGVVDTTDAYVVYASMIPFDKTKMPEDETDLIDISPDTKDVANVGKLAKCFIVRDGKVNFEITNDSSDDKVIFLKWEKLSNWTTPGTTRRTGAATNYDVRVIGSNTDEITPPTWTYFGGGFLKLDREFKWEEVE